MHSGVVDNGLGLEGAHSRCGKLINLKTMMVDLVPRLRRCPGFRQRIGEPKPVQDYVLGSCSSARGTGTGGLGVRHSMRDSLQLLCSGGQSRSFFLPA